WVPRPGYAAPHVDGKPSRPAAPRETPLTERCRRPFASTSRRTSGIRLARHPSSPRSS
ncbi:MAG: hypothetical protein AVDCRST_MAG33-3199, partial [uncultured Thermomicrobiales bacterium]